MDLLPGIDQKVDLLRDGNLARTDMPTALRNLRYQGQLGKHLLLASISPFDPGTDIRLERPVTANPPLPEMIYVHYLFLCPLGYWPVLTLSGLI
jgi:hypothetical protein